MYQGTRFDIPKSHLQGLESGRNWVIVNLLLTGCVFVPVLTIV